MADGIAEQWGKLDADQRKEAMARMTDEQKHQLADALGYGGSPRIATVSAAPPKGSLKDIEGRLMTARDWLIDQLPGAGGFVGGLIGLGAGAETGPGAVATSAVGAAAGGGLGEDARQMLDEHFHPEDAMTPKTAALKLLRQTALQGGNEVAGQVAGRVVGSGIHAAADKAGLINDALEKYPFLKDLFSVGEGRSPRAVPHLVAATADRPARDQAGQALGYISNTIGDIEQELTKLPEKERTVNGFLKAVNARKDAMNAEKAGAMMAPVDVPGVAKKIPLAAVETVPTGIADRIKALITPSMEQTPEGRYEAKIILNTAKDYEKPWTFRQLDDMRMRVRARLDAFHRLEPVPQYTAKKGSITKAIDDAIERGIKETVYPAMDRAAGKPEGYFANLQARQANLIGLQNLLDKRVKHLAGAQAIGEVTPALSKENISLSAHPGSMPRAGLYGIRDAIARTREMNQASRHVSKAFPTVDSMPYQVLFSGLTRVAEMPGPKPRTKTQHLKDLRDSYAFTDNSQQ